MGIALPKFRYYLFEFVVTKTNKAVKAGAHKNLYAWSIHFCGCNMETLSGKFCEHVLA